MRKLNDLALQPKAGRAAPHFSPTEGIAEWEGKHLPFPALRGPVYALSAT